MLIKTEICACVRPAPSASSKTPSSTRPNLAGVPDVLIFFCFFSSIKRRKESMDHVRAHVKTRRERKNKEHRPPQTKRISARLTARSPSTSAQANAPGSNLRRNSASGVP